MKRSKNLTLRDRTQELQVLRKLKVTDPIEERFLNILFELTIMSEAQEETIKNPGTLQEVLAEFICLPGDKISTKECADTPFIRKALSRGAHVVDEDCESFDLRIMISRNTENDCVKIWNISSHDSANSPKRSDNPRVIKVEVSE